jgi:hypothetical protein
VAAFQGEDGSESGGRVRCRGEILSATIVVR